MTGSLPNSLRNRSKKPGFAAPRVRPMRATRWIVWMLILGLAHGWAVPTTNYGGAVEEFQLSQEEKLYSTIPDLRKGVTPEALARLQKEAADGNVKAQAALGTCYQIGYGVPKDLSKAAEWYQLAAKGGNVSAENNLGELYLTGMGVPLDRAKAHELFLQAAQQNSKIAQFNLGLDYARGLSVPQDWQEARRWYEKAAAQGDSMALINLGNIYVKGRGVPANMEQARKYLQIPAQAGTPLAEFGMAVTYMIEENFAAALPWLQRSAEAGHPPAELFWAMYLSNGTAGKLDLPTAIYWARKALAGLPQTNPDFVPQAHTELGRMLMNLNTPESNAESFREASAAAATGYADGQNLLGVCYHRGAGVERDLTTAFKWYQLAAAQGNITAADNLGSMYGAGKGVPRDFAEAVKWDRIAADGGVTLAQYRLGMAYRDGTGVDINLKEADKWLRMVLKVSPGDVKLKNVVAQIEAQLNATDAEAAYRKGASLAQAAQSSGGSMDEALKALNEAVDRGHPFATTALAHMYRLGAGVPKDDERAEALVARIAQSTNPVVLWQIGTTYLPMGAQMLGPKDADRAISYFLRSAQQGYGAAVTPLGLCYMAASPEHQDFVSAFVWLSLTAAQGDANAQMYLERLRPRMTNAQTAEAVQKLGALRSRNAPPVPAGATGGLSSNVPTQAAPPLGQPVK